MMPQTLPQDRSLFKLSQTKIKLKTNLQNLINQQSYVVGSYEGNYVIYTRKFYEVDFLRLSHHFLLISPSGDLTNYYHTHGFGLQVEMPAPGLILILRQTKKYSLPEGQIFQLTQWNLQDNSIVDFFVQNALQFSSTKMLIFPESSLVCIYTYCKKMEYLKYERFINYFQVKLTYYRYPLKSKNNEIVGPFKFVEKASKNLQWVHFEKMNNQSKLAIWFEHRDRIKQNGIEFYIFSLEKGLEKHQIIYEYRPYNLPKILQIQEMKTGEIFISIKEESKQNNYFLIDKRKLEETKIILPSIYWNSRFQFKGYFKKDDIYEPNSLLFIPRYYLDPETFEIFRWIQAENLESSLDWKMVVPNSENNLQIWSRLNVQNGQQINIKEVRLKIIPTSWKKILINKEFDEDLVHQVHELL